MAYKLTLSEKIKTLLEDNLGDAFKQYFNGDPLAIAQSFLPCVCVVKRNSKVRSIATGIDEREVNLTVRVVFNKKNEFGKSANESTTQKTMENIIEGIDDATGTYHNNSIMGVLRRNYSLEGYVLQNDADINYYPNDERGNGMITIEADIDLRFVERYTVNRA